ncbi:glycosyltransferase family 4 protein [Candidatus Micrarchaeota archaeon]|nr:glycosyltransferase family 4 protein [Candidatus Micrarchaeota archaeon]
MHFLVLGSKEYPVGQGQNADPLPSGGMERYTQELADGLKKAGHDVTVVTRRFGRKKYEDLRGIRVERVGWISGFFLRNPSFNLNAYRRARSLDYDVCIAQGALATLAALALKAEKKKPVIARPAGVAFLQPQYPAWLKALLYRLERFAYRHADAVVFPNPQEQEAFKKKLGFRPSRAVLIPTGVNAKRFRPRKKAKKRQPTVVFVGRLQKVKGTQYLIDAMAGLDARLDIVGSGPEEKHLKKRVAEKGLEKKIRFMGNQTNVEPLLSKADAFVLPSLSEGLPIALLEAWAAKVPAVVTDIGLPAENGKDALVVKPGDSNALRQAIGRILSNEKLARRLSENAYRRVMREYNWDHAVKKYVEVAKRLCAAS